MNPVPDLHPNLESTLAALRADGINPTDAEVVWLARLRWPCDHPRHGVKELVGAPVEIGGDTFWPLHRLAEYWFVAAGEILGDEGTRKTDAYLFAHTRSAPGDRSLLLITGEDAIAQTVHDWRAGLALHDENVPDLVRLLRHIDGYADEAAPRPATEEPGELDGIGTLCKMFPGTTPDYWRSGISIAETEALFESTSKQAWAESSKRTAAIENYLLAVKQVRANHGK